MPENRETSNVLTRLARLVGATPNALVAAAQAEQPRLSAEARATLVDRRRALMQAGEEAARVLADRLGAIQERVSEARKRFAEARSRLNEVVAERVDAELDHSAEAAARDREVRAIEAELRGSADVRIGAFVKELQDEHDALRLQGPTTYKSVPNPLTDARRLFSNYGSLVARLDALRGAIAGAEALKLEALGGEEIEPRLDALRRTLPEVEVRLAGVA